MKKWKNLFRLPASKVIFLTNNNKNNRIIKLTSEEHAQK